MSILKVKLTGEGEINNAVIFLEDPMEKIPLHLQPDSTTVWQLSDISVPIEGDLDYSLIVIAFSGTRFECTITNTDDDSSATFSGITGKKIKNYYHEKDSQKLK